MKPLKLTTSEARALRVALITAIDERESFIDAYSNCNPRDPYTRQAVGGAKRWIKRYHALIAKLEKLASTRDG